MAIEKILNKRSNAVVTDGGAESPKKPTSSQLDNGEIAVNYHKGMERLFIKNDNDEVVDFVSKNETDKKYDKVDGVNIVRKEFEDESGTYTEGVVEIDNGVMNTMLRPYQINFTSGSEKGKITFVPKGHTIDGKYIPPGIKCEYKTGDDPLENDLRIARMCDIPSVTPQVQSDWNETDTTSKGYILNKPTIPTKTSEINNDSGFIDKEDIAPVEEVTKSRNNYDSSAGVISFITGDGEVYYPSVKGGRVSFYESTVDMIFSNDFISLARYSISFVKDTASSVQIKDGDNVLYTVVPYSPVGGPVFYIKSLIKNSNGTYTAVVNNGGGDYGWTTITFNSNTLTIAPVGSPSYMTTSLQDVSDSAITYLGHIELNTLHKVAITGSYNDLNDKPNIPDVTGKADKVINAINDNFAALDANGDLKDSGHKHSDYQARLVSGTNIKTINSTSILTSGNLNLVTGVTINNTTKTPTNGTVNLGTVLTSTTSSVTSGSTTPITSGGVYTALQSKQNTINDLATIRSGAQAGATAVQPVQGKGLSTNDYTDVDKDIITSIADLPTAKQLVIGDIVITLNPNGTVTWAEVPHLTKNDLYSISDTDLGVSLLEVDPQYPDEPAGGAFDYGPENPYPTDGTFTPHLTIAVNDSLPTSVVISEMTVGISTRTQQIDYGPFSVAYASNDGNGHNLYTVQNVPTVEADDCIYFFIYDEGGNEIGNSVVFVVGPLKPQVTSSNESVSGIAVLTEASMMYQTGVGNLSFSPNLKDGDTIRLKGTVVDTTQSYPDLTFDFTGTINGTPVVPGEPTNITWNSGSDVAFEYLVPSLGAFGLYSIDERDGCRIKMQELQIWVNGVECVIN